MWFVTRAEGSALKRQLDFTYITYMFASGMWEHDKSVRAF